MTSNHLGSRAGRQATTAVVGLGFALLTLTTHAANFGFVVLGGRLLPPDEFGQLVALLGIVLLGLAPGMAVQAITAARVLGAGELIDPALGRRLSNAVGLTVLVVTTGAWVVLGLSTPLALLSIPLAAALLTRTAMNEGLLQGHERFVVLGGVMLSGALVKLSTGAALMVTIGGVGTATVAVALGYAVQLAFSRRSTAMHRSAATTGRGRTDVAYAVLLMGTLLLVVHLDAVFAPALLDGPEAGMYGVGVTAARITFWMPQFAVLLWFPRMVRDGGLGMLAGGLGAVLALGLLGTAAAVVLGPFLATVVFGEELGSVGPELWRFVCIGTAALCLQVLALADLAMGRRRAWSILVPALLGVAAVLLLTTPTTAAAAGGSVAAVLGAVAAGGSLWSLVAVSRRPAPA